MGRITVALRSEHLRGVEEAVVEALRGTPAVRAVWLSVFRLRVYATILCRAADREEARTEVDLALAPLLEDELIDLDYEPITSEPSWLTSSRSHRLVFRRPPAGGAAEVLGEELTARHLTVEAFAQASGLEVAALRGILAGTEPLAPHAAAISAVLGTSEALWVRLDAETAS